MDTKGETLDEKIDEVDGVGLRVAPVDLQGADPCSVINRGVVVTLDLLILCSSEDQELDVHLDMVAWHLFVVALGMDLPRTRPPRKAVQAMPLQSAIDARVRDFDGVIALLIPDDPDRSEMVLESEVKDLLFDPRRHLVRMIVWHRARPVSPSSE